jgi:hypothetical protein
VLPDPILGAPTERPSSSVRLGTVVRDDDGRLVVATGGVVIPARWADPVVVDEGDAVLVVLAGGPTGQSEAIVQCRVTARPRPGQGEVTEVPVGSSTIVVATAEGTVQARFVASYSPTLGDVVALSWEASQATVLGEVGSVPAPTPPPAPPKPPPPKPQTGVSWFTAIDSGTARVGGSWNATAGQNLWQGSWPGAGNFAGAWFYGSAPRSLIGRTITRVRLHVGARRRMGNYNATIPLHLYLHNQAVRPGGDVIRIAGPHDIQMPPNWGGGWVDIPTGWASTLVLGGGISIAGNPYGGVQGRGENPQSGVLEFTWRV